jgi:hypothetical protein
VWLARSEWSLKRPISTSSERESPSDEPALLPLH